MKSYKISVNYVLKLPLFKIIFTFQTDEVIKDVSKK